MRRKDVRCVILDERIPWSPKIRVPAISTSNRHRSWLPGVPPLDQSKGRSMDEQEAQGCSMSGLNKREARWLCSAVGLMSPRLLAKLTFCLCVLFASCETVRVPPAFERSLSMDSGYRHGASSERAIAGAQVEIVQGTSVMFDTVVERSGQAAPWVRVPLALALSALYATKVAVGLHEFGHLSRGNAAGGDVQMGFRGGSAQGRWTTNYFSYLLHGMTHSRDSGLARSRRPIADAALNAGSSMGGVNAEMYGAQRFAETIQTSGGHVLYGVPYVMGRMSSLAYIERVNRNRPSNDLVAIRRYYQESRSFDINFEDIKLGSAMSLLASGTTYSLANGVWQFLSTGDPRFESLQFSAPGWAALRVPETSFYHSTRGLSLKVDSGYRVDDSLFLPFGVEYVYKGDRYAEVSAGIQKVFWEDYTFRSLLFVGANLSAESSVGYRVNRSMNLELGLSHYHRDTQHGQRHSPDLLSRQQDELWVRVSYVF